MGVILECEESTFTGFIEDGEVSSAKVLTVKLKEKPFKDDKGDSVKKFEFHFKLTGGDHDGQDIWGETSTHFNTHPECRLHAWAESLLGFRIGPQYRLNTDDLQDRDCIVVIGKSVRQTANGEKTRNFVRDVLPTGANAARLAADDTNEPF